MALTRSAVRRVETLTARPRLELAKPNGPDPSWVGSLVTQAWTPFAQSTSGAAAWQKGNRVVDVQMPGTYAGIIQNLVTAFSGACASAELLELYLACQGGHSAYAGNEIYGLSLNQATPAWSRLKDASATANIAANNPGENAPYVANLDATPRTHHGWWQDYCDKFGFIWIGQSGPRDDGTGTHQSGYWSIDRNNLAGGWMWNGRLFVSSSEGGLDAAALSWGTNILFQSAPGAYDPVTNKIWRCVQQIATGDPPVRAFDCNAARTFGEAAHTGNNLIAGCQRLGNAGIASGTTAFDNSWGVVLTDKSPRCLLFKRNSGGLSVFDVQTPGADFVDIPAGNITGTNPNYSGMNAFYVPTHSAVYVFGGNVNATGGGSILNGGEVYKLAISGSDPRTATYTWSQLTNDVSSVAISSDADPGSGYPGTFSKAQGFLMPSGQPVLVMALFVDGPTYVYKLSP